jgi:hypothetical protein
MLFTVLQNLKKLKYAFALNFTFYFHERELSGPRLNHIIGYKMMEILCNPQADFYNIIGNIWVVLPPLWRNQLPDTLKF